MADRHVTETPFTVDLRGVTSVKKGGLSSASTTVLQAKAIPAVL